MHEFDRRELLMMSSAGAVVLGASAGSSEGAQTAIAQTKGAAVVRLHGDGLGYSPSEYAAVMTRLAEEGAVEVDNYSLGGSVERLEQEMARRLGKERAVFFPTGTLANQIAVRVLARGRGQRVLVQEESHIYNDAGDGCQQLSGLHLVGLEPGEPTFSLERVQEEVQRAAAGRVQSPVGVISIESPVRRLWGQVFDIEQMRRISAFARERGIGMHMDGARMYLAEPYTGVGPAEYASLFDTVYVSLWKYFNAAAGAILAGPADLLDDLFHDRRRFGGSLPRAWWLASMAEFHLDGFEQRFAAAVAVSEQVLASLEKHSAFGVERTPVGTNVSRLEVKAGDLEGFLDRLAGSGIEIGRPLSDGSGFKVQVNETWLRLGAEDIADRIVRALG